MKAGSVREAKADIVRVFLKPGEVFIAREPTIISTILGSCVSVTMFNPRLKAGAMCHALLPKNSGISETEGSRFVDYAIPHMVRGLERFGIGRQEIEVKLFGGSDVLNFGGREVATVGTQNVAKALEILEQERLPLMVMDVRGTQGRKLFFRTYTGEVFLKRIRKTSCGES